MMYAQLDSLWIQILKIDLKMWSIKNQKNKTIVVSKNNHFL